MFVRHIGPCYSCAIVFGIEGPVANIKVALMMRVKTDAGWRYYPAAYAANGRVKPGTAVVAGKDVKHPTITTRCGTVRGPDPFLSH